MRKRVYKVHSCPPPCSLAPWSLLSTTHEKSDKTSHDIDPTEFCQSIRPGRKFWYAQKPNFSEKLGFLQAENMPKFDRVLILVAPHISLQFGLFGATYEFSCSSSNPRSNAGQEEAHPSGNVLCDGVAGGECAGDASRRLNAG